MARFFTHYANRRLEWAISLYTLIFGLMLLLPPSSMADAATYSTVLSLLPEHVWGAVYAVVGACHLSALHVNGRGAWTPFARLAALTINSQVFLGLALAFAGANPVGTATVTYGSFAVLFCGPAIWSAAQDCGREVAIWRRRAA